MKKENDKLRKHVEQGMKNEGAFYATAIVKALVSEEELPKILPMLSNIERKGTKKKGGNHNV